MKKKGDALELQLKQIRMSRKLKQIDVAEALSIPLRTYGSYERGERSLTLEYACTIADYFDITLDELAGREWHDPSLSTDEQQLVSDYRYMTKRQQDSLRGMASSVADGGLAKNDEFSEKAV